MKRNIYNISAGESFVDVLAKRFLDQYKDNPKELSYVLFLLPTRRACQSLSEAFLRHHGLRPTILPKIAPIMDVEEDEIFLTGNAEMLSDLKSKADDMECVLTLTRLILQKAQSEKQNVSAGQAYALAQNLKSLMETVKNQELNFNELKNLVAAEYAEHWQKTLELLKIITQFWPEILAEKGKTDAVDYRQSLLKAQIALWQQNPPKQKIVIAGTTAVYPIIKRLVQTVCDLPNGELYLYGLDKYLDEESWQLAGKDENHPQYELKELLDFLQIDRSEIENLGRTNIERERMVSEVMRPSETTLKWHNLAQNGLPITAFDGIKLVNCNDLRQEAKAVAMIIRETLETPEKTAALVTTDRNLSRRVVSELQKWDINADDSAGQPLHLAPIGIYLRLILEVLEKNTQAAQISLMKHPYTACGMSQRDFNIKRNHLELVLRGKEDFAEETRELGDEFWRRMQPLKDLYERPSVNLKEMFITHLEVAQSLADTDEKKGEQIIWRRDDGHIATDFTEEFLLYCETVGQIKTNDYAGLLDKILAGYSVRKIYGLHPRVKILGPIEARLACYDVMIVGEVNEGNWPNLPTADMWMSRPMKKDFGLPSPERSVGVAAADFAHLLNAPKVYLTRAEKVDDTPTNKSRWWLRFETVLKANFPDDIKRCEFLYDKKYASLACEVDRQGQYQPIEPPHPRPSLKMRPRELSATNIEILRRDPYTIFAKYILKLFPLDELDQEAQAYDFGNLVHKVLQIFNKKYKHSFPNNAMDELLKIGRDEFAATEVSSEQYAFWYPRFVKAMEWIVAKEQIYRQDIATVHSEVPGSMVLPVDGRNFVIKAKADRVDETKDGHLNVIDYKTGHGRTCQEMETGKAPQLPIEALIAEAGGYEEVPAKKVSSLRYWTFEKETATNAEQTATAMDKTKDSLCRLIRAFDDESRPYLARPVPSKQPIYTDYEHLSRFLEWAVKDDSGENEQAGEN